MTHFMGGWRFCTVPIVVLTNSFALLCCLPPPSAIVQPVMESPRTTPSLAASNEDECDEGLALLRRRPSIRDRKKV